MKDMTDVKAIATAARSAIGTVIHGQEGPVELLLIALTAGGHTLLEGVPGIGKTTLAKTFATVSGLDFRRVQLTPDLMPSDITGHSFYNQAKGNFELRKGPVFANLLLADEINRAPPRTQAALLEVMEEHQVTIDGNSMPVPQPFLVVATKNPIDIEGIYPLPEAQLDRFMLFIPLHYPPREIEQDMLLGKLRKRTPPQPIPDLVKTLRSAFAQVRVENDVVAYAMDICRATRSHAEVELGAGPRAGEHLVAASRARALLEGRDYVIPDDIQYMAPYVIAHRLILVPDAEIRQVDKPDVVKDILERIQVPVEAPEAKA